MNLTRLGRNAAIAAVSAAAVAVGATTTAAAAPAPESAQSQPAGDSVILDAGAFSFTSGDGTIDVRDAAGNVVESIPLTLPGTDVAAPVDAAIGADGKTLTLHRVEADAVGQFNKLVGEWLWGVQNGGAFGAAIGSVVGCWLLVFGCIPGLVIGGAMGSPNAAQIQQTFMDMLANR
ncbi:hypothetical protein [Tomitella fengzijianii]|uniref:DUF8020 domain-containing protein n=1 Tax=Tomitella fengzijianii TaxID=2597660 RepID=A0A516X0N0_9ACTN|nr:hypothetical protein [Tomitella fengzijianii]QDQ96613.1 hypothetical protein FO059_03755 [Tomitella fengzijianii]